MIAWNRWIGFAAVGLALCLGTARDGITKCERLDPQPPQCGDCDGTVAALYGSACEVVITVSPHTIVPASGGPWVTVHVDIPYSIVDTASLTLNGVAVAWTKADLQGNLVAKFESTAVREIVEAPRTTLTLSGMTVEGMTFSGSDTVAVKD